MTFHFRDADHANFEYAFFLTGTHNDDEEQVGRPEYINIHKVRVPKLSSTQKTTIDYTALDRHSHSKI